MLLELVSPNRTEVAKICSSPDSIDLLFLGIIRLFGSMRIPPGVNGPRLLVEPVGDRSWEEYGDDQTDEHLDSEENEAEEERGVFPGRKSPNEGDVRHVSVFAAVLMSGCRGGEERKGTRGVGGADNGHHHRSVTQVSKCDHKHVKPQKCIRS